MPHSSMLPASLLASDLSPVRRRLSTDAVAPPQRFEYWLDMICAMYVQLECDGADNGEFFGDIEFSRLGSLDMTRLQSNAKRVRRTPSHIRRAAMTAAWFKFNARVAGWFAKTDAWPCSIRATLCCTTARAPMS